MEYCPNCGAEVYPGEAVCEVCGARLRAKRRAPRRVKASYRPADLKPTLYRASGYGPAAPVAKSRRLEGVERPASAALLPVTRDPSSSSLRAHPAPTS